MFQWWCLTINLLPLVCFSDDVSNVFSCLLQASAMVSHNTLVTSQTPPSTQPSSQPQTQPVVTQTPTQPSNISSPRSINCSVPASTDFLRSQPPPATFRGAPEFTPSFFTNGQGAGLFRPGFPSFQHSAHHPSMLSHAPISSNATTNGEFGEYFKIILVVLPRLLAYYFFLCAHTSEFRSELLWRNWW